MQVESSPQQVRQIVRDVRRSGRTIGCVPTMGALHAGHVSLIQQARTQCDFVIATIFVNPTQFGPNEDFSRYPRTIESDLKLCEEAGADLVFTPETSAMYASDAQTVVRVTELSGILEGAHRPGHFDGVSTVVTKLFNITEPDRAYFGQKDYQQQAIIRKMVADLNQPVEIVTCPIVRESDGLAMSSRNRYLSGSERQLAVRLFQTLEMASKLAADSRLTPADIESRMAAFLSAEKEIQLQYAVIVDREMLRPLSGRSDRAIALVAACIGTTRLIDNHHLCFRDVQEQGGMPAPR